MCGLLVSMLARILPADSQTVASAENSNQIVRFGFRRIRTCTSTGISIQDIQATFAVSKERLPFTQKITPLGDLEETV